MAQHHGKGHPAFKDGEAVEFVKRNGVVTTAELAEEFGVSDVAIRKRLKNGIDAIESRKVRNRRVYYVPHETHSPPAGTDGGLTGFESSALWLGTVCAVASALGLVAVLGLSLEPLGLWPRAFGDIHLTVYVLAASIGVFVGALALILSVVFAEWLRYCRRRLWTEWQLTVRPRKQRIESWVAANRPGGP